MSVVENFFEKFEKGELRLAEEVIDVSGISDPTNQTATISDLVNVESVESVEVKTDGSEFKAFDETSATDTNVVGGLGSPSSSDDNVVDITYYTIDPSNAEFVAAESADDMGNITEVKITARGY